MKINLLSTFVSICLSIALSFSLYAQNSMTISPIGPQSIIAGGSMPIFFSGVNGQKDGIVFTSYDLPSFISIEIDGDNAGRFMVNTTDANIGTYDFHLESSYNNKSATIPVHLTVFEVTGTKYYCDPTNGDINNSGDENNPWKTLQEVFSSNKNFNDGDVIYLRNGYHGAPGVKGYNTSSTYIVAQSNHNPEVSKFVFASCSRWVVSGLTISPEVINQTSLSKTVEFKPSSLYNTIENCEIYGIKNSGIWSTNQDWYDNIGDGVWSEGKNTLVRNNYIYNTYFAVHIFKENSKVLFNTIDRYAGDAIRGLANDTEYSYNVIKNPTVDDYDTGNHDDAFQSWTSAYGPPKKNIKISGNQVFSSTYSGIPLISRIMQGIINFDGFSEDWEISNNLVVLDHWHGITLVGAKNCKIVNNTIIKNPINEFQFGHPWIGIWPTKESAGSVPSTGNLVRNNVVPQYATQGDLPGDADHNIISSAYTNLFMDYNNWDFRPKSATLKDKGFNADATSFDIELKKRDNNVDIGCYESNANITDFVAPTRVDGLIGKGDTPCALELEWSPSYDENGIAYYIVSIENSKKTIKTSQTKAIINGIKGGDSRTFMVTAYDNFGNKSETSNPLTLTSSENLENTEVFCIPSDRYDQLIRSIKRLMWVGMPTLNVGGAYTGRDASAVFPFKLPRIKDNHVIMSAQFMIGYQGMNNTPSGALDLYGLSFRKEADVLFDDHWQGTYETNTFGTAINQDFVTNNSSEGIITTSVSGSENLKNFLIASYADGAKVNNYTFLRLNPNIADEQDNAYYSLTSHETDDTYMRPLIKIIAHDPTGVALEKIENGIEVFPNPCSKSNVTIKLNDFINGEKVHIILHNINGIKVYDKIQTNNQIENKISLPLNYHPNGYYFITVLSNEKYAESKILLVE